MKKYNYLNTSQKLLLAAMTIPLAVLVLPITENVSASEIPVLNVYDLNGNPKLEWSTQILQENIIENVDIENALNLNLTGHYINNISIVKNNGENVLRYTRSYDGLGNGAWYPSTEEDFSLVYSKNRYLFEKGTNLTMSMKVKSKGESVIMPISEGYYFDNLPKKGLITRPIASNDNFFYTELSTVNDFYIGQQVVYHLNDELLSIALAFITDIDKSTGKISLDRGINNNNVFYNIGDSVMTMNRNSFDFNKRIISNENEWTNLSFNTSLDADDYDYSRKSFLFILKSFVEEELLMKDIVFAHATEVEVYRDGQSIYKGYLSDFHDTTVRDTAKPNKVTTINSSITNDFNVKLNIIKPEDNGVKKNYQIQSISKNGNRSALSTPQEIEVKSDVIKYKYDISNQEVTTPSIETNSLNDILIPLKSVNLDTDYLHIQAIDGNGNIGDVSSFKLNTLIDMQDLYDKVKELENSNSYEDFIDFIEEIENLYGDNLPQDLKEMIDRLGQHHGVNTSFLLLEEGDFRLSTMDINSFGHTKLTAKKQTLTTSFKGDFGVVDARGTQEGWNLSVSATPFTVETFDGFVGTPHQLPIGSLALNNVNHVEQVGQVHNSQLPDITLNQLTAIDGQNNTVNLLNADKHKGMGEFKFSFTEDALALTVDAVTAKIDTVNYPDSNTPYISTVTWDLVSGPSI